MSKSRQWQSWFHTAPGALQKSVLEQHRHQVLCLSSLSLKSQHNNQTTNSKMSNHAQEPPLFDSTLISPAVVASLPPNYVIRPLARSDFFHGFLDVLRVLTSVGEITESKWNDQYDWMQRRNDEYFIMVIWDGKKVVGTGTVLIERKLWGFSLASLSS